MAIKLESATEVSRDLEATDKTRSAPSPPVEPTITDGHGPVQLAIELVQGCITRQEVPVAVVGRYVGLPPLGVLAVFDQALNFWVKRAVDLRMIGSQLGELFHIPLIQKQVAPEGLLLAGMGEPGRFSREDLRLLMMNVVVALKGLGYDRFSTILIGSSRGGLPIDRALRAMLEGIIDGLDRLPGSISRQLEVTLVEADPSRFVALRGLLENFGKTWIVPRLELSLSTREESCPVSAEEERSSTPPDLMPDLGPMTRITISSSPSSGPTGPTAPGAPSGLVFQYSALSDSAVIPVREQEVKSSFVEPLPRRLLGATSQEDQFGYGRLLASYLLPEDFLRLLDEDTTLTLVLDSTSALFPWEMAVLRGYRTRSFFGPELRLTRQFRTLLSAAPGIPPPLNDNLKVLVIADPAPPPYNLDGARREGLAVVRALGLAKQAWGAALKLEVVVRIGAATGASRAGLVAELEKIPGHDDFIIDVDSCEPLEILKLLLNDHFDVLHYAGHGVYDPAGRGKGWVFDERCTLSATEIFKVPQVPRLVFANACHSSEVDASERPLSAIMIQNVSLAEAFFARGIQNYIGAGWPVDDDQAVAFATQFYLQALGIQLTPPRLVELNGAAPPDTLGDALARARRFLLESGCRGTTWGAYQHYGHANAKLLSFTNDDAEAANRTRSARSAGAGT